MRPLAALTLALCASACAGTTGTIGVDLVTAPGSHLLDAVQRLRLTITEPHQVVEAMRTASGFDLALELDAGDATGALIVEGFDAAGARIACGQSPRFPVAAINAHVVVYIAPPGSIAIAPAALPGPRSEVSATAISYGAVLAGGRDPGGAPTTEIAVYNAFDHSLIAGVPLPGARAGLAMAAGAGGGVYLFGGTGPDGNPTGTLWRFDTTAAPNGSFATLADQPSHARTRQLLVPIAAERYLVTGTPALELRSGTLAERSGIPALPAAGAGVSPGDGNPTAVFAGESVLRFRGEAFDSLASPPRGDDVAATALPDGRIAVFGGADPASGHDALVIDGKTGVVTVIPGALATLRSHPALAATSRHVVIAGGTDAGGAPIATAEVLDVRSLARIATLPILPRSGGFAIALPNDQVLLGGGAPAAAALELFTPEPPP